MDVIRTLIYGILLDTFYVEKKKKLIILTSFYIFHKSSIKIFVNSLLINALKTPINKTLK